MSAHRRLLLASSSTHRAQLLARLEIAFETAVPEFDERSHDAAFGQLGPEAFALRMALGKAASLRASHPDAWILAADQIAVREGDLLTKPTSIEDAVHQLMGLAGKTHELVTGVVLLPPGDADPRETVDRQRMTMRRFDEAEARAYVTNYEPLECVGSYRIEDAGIKLFERIEGGDYTGIIGLPLLAVARLLRSAGLLD